MYEHTNSAWVLTILALFAVLVLEAAAGVV